MYLTLSGLSKRGLLSGECMQCVLQGGLSKGGLLYTILQSQSSVCLRLNNAVFFVLPGVPLYIIPDNVIYDPPLLCNFLKENRITRILFTPSLLEAVLNAEGVDVSGCLKDMRFVNQSGYLCIRTIPRQFILKRKPFSVYVHNCIS